MRAPSMTVNSNRNAPTVIEYVAPVGSEEVQQVFLISDENDITLDKYFDH